VIAPSKTDYDLARPDCRYDDLLLSKRCKTTLGLQLCTHL